MRTIPTPGWLEREWDCAHPVERVGSSEFRISRDGTLFFKRRPDRPDLIRHEYDALRALQGTSGIEGLRTLEAVGLTHGSATLVTRFCRGTPLAAVSDPEVYRAFGRKLRRLHEGGHTHGHLAPDDVLVDGDQFVLTDLAFWDRVPPHRDVVTMRLNIRVRSVQKPWQSWALGHSWGAFGEGYRLSWGADHQDELERIVGRRVRTRLRAGRPSGLAMAVCWFYLTARPQT